jgi:hypothetical protein
MRSDRIRRFSASFGGNPRSLKTLCIIIMIVLSVWVRIRISSTPLPTIGSYNGNATNLMIGQAVSELDGIGYLLLRYDVEWVTFDPLLY